MKVLVSKVGSSTSVIEVITGIIDRVEKEARDYASHAERIVLDRTPFETGYLKSNTGVRLDISNSSIIVEFKSRAPYAAYQEFGTIEWVDTGYIATHGLDSFAGQFKSGTRKTTGGVPSKRYFFGPIRFWTLDFVVRLRKLGFK